MCNVRWESSHYHQAFKAAALLFSAVLITKLEEIIENENAFKKILPRARKYFLIL
jgi:hypothetical protein